MEQSHRERPLKGDGGPAAAAEISPYGLAVTADGGFLIADTDNHRVRRVARDGMISTAAGTGQQGFFGDGGPAPAARLSRPEGVAVTADGGFLIADTGNDRVRRVSPDGTITTIVFYPTVGQLDAPHAVAPTADGGLVIADFERVRQVTPDGKLAFVVSSFWAGDFGSGFDFPGGVAATGDGGLLIAERDCSRIRRVAPHTGQRGLRGFWRNRKRRRVRTVAGRGKRLGEFSGDGGPATAARLTSPEGVAVTSDGGFLIADTGNDRVRRVDPDGTIATVAGNGKSEFSGDGGPAIAAGLNRPKAVAVTSDGGFLIADTGNHRVRRVDPDGMITTVAGATAFGFSGDGGPATAARLSQPKGVAVTGDGGFLVADSDNERVRRVSANGTISTVAGTGESGFSGDGELATAARLRQPEGVAVTADGGFLIADTGNDRVRCVAPDGTISTVAGTGEWGKRRIGDRRRATTAPLRHPEGVVVAADGGFLIPDAYDNRVRRVSPEGTISTVAGTGHEGFSGDGGPATAAQLSYPHAVAPTAAGGFLIADTHNRRVRHVARDGTITTVAGTGEWAFSGDGGPATATCLSHPTGVAVTADGGFLIADAGNHRVRRVAPDGRITTVAGNGEPGFSGDAGLATAARLKHPEGVAVTADGGFLIADTENHRVRRVVADGTISTVAGGGQWGFWATVPERRRQPASRGFLGDSGPVTVDTGLGWEIVFEEVVVVVALVLLFIGLVLVVIGLF